MAAVPIPSALARRVARSRFVVEVGAGAAFESALALHALAPGARFLLTDVDPRVLAAPAPLEAIVHDITRDPDAPFAGADLLVAIRPPEDLQPVLARVARRLGADLALRALKDEWADLGVPVRWDPWPDGWRFVPSMRGRES